MISKTQLHLGHFSLELIFPYTGANECLSILIAGAQTRVETRENKIVFQYIGERKSSKTFSHLGAGETAAAFGFRIDRKMEISFSKIHYSIQLW